MSAGAGRCRVVGLALDPIDYAEACLRILAPEQPSGYVCVANVHMTMEAHDDPAFAEVVEGAALVVSDGMPLVHMMRRLGHPRQTRVYGPTLMLHLCAAAAAADLPLALYGGLPEDVAALSKFLPERYPGLRIVYAHSPPFRPLTPSEEEQTCVEIAASGAAVLLVGLGCPKQERWMARNAAHLPLISVGIGAGFAFHTGRVAQAPAWLQRLSLEWAFRLLVEPRRLWRRYLVHNPRFVAFALWQLLRRRD